MNILVIGNGFDLAHGLPTKYTDFLKFVRSLMELSREVDYASFLNAESTNGLDENVKEYLCVEENFIPEMCKKEIVKMIQLCEDNVWINYFLNNESYLKEGWIDFESEISGVIQYLNLAKKSRKYKCDWKDFNIDLKKFNQYIKEIIDELIDKSFNKDLGQEKITLNFLHMNYGQYNRYWKYFSDRLLEDMNRLIKCLELYLAYCVNAISIKYNILDVIENRIDKVLNFNYTNTFTRIYDINRNIECDFIHGEARESLDMYENNMVLGIDEFLSKDEKDIEIDFIDFKKYFQRTLKVPNNIYNNWINEMNFDLEYHNSPKIFIIGHSLDITDKDVLEKLFNSGVEIIIFYHDNQAKLRLMRNVVRIIG